MPDLYTNLILNDSRFKSGLQDAERRAESFGRSINEMNQRFAMLGKVARGAGALALVNTALDLSVKIMERFSREVDSSASAWERFDASLSPVLGTLDEMIFRGNAAKAAWEITKLTEGNFIKIEETGRAFEQISAALNLQLQTLRETDPVSRSIAAAERERLATANKLAELQRAGLSMTAYRSGLGTADAIRDERVAQARADQEKRRQQDRDRQLLDQQRQLMDRANGRFGFQEQMDRDRASLLRQQGLKKEADLLELQLEYRRRIREVVTDTTSGYTFAEKDAMIAALRYSYEQRAAMLGKNEAPKYDRSVSFDAGVTGAAGLLGQVFAVGARAPFAKAEETLKAVEKNTAAEVRLLKSIDAGIKHVGVYR